MDGAGSVIFGVALGGGAQERELVARERLRALQLALRVGRGERDLVAVIVAEIEHRGLDREAVDALDEARPVRRCGGTRRRSRRSSPTSSCMRTASRMHWSWICGEACVIDPCREVIAERLAQIGRPQQAADMVGAEWRTAIRTQAHVNPHLLRVGPPWQRGG